MEWTWTEQNCFDKLTEVQNFTSGLTECTGDGAYICITSGENGFEGFTSGRTSRAAPSQLKIKEQERFRMVPHTFPAKIISGGQQEEGHGVVHHVQ